MAHLVDETRISSSRIYDLDCVECGTELALECMESCLISDPTVILYSTSEILNKVAQIYDCYMANKCRCIVKDIACLYCGNVVGYQIIQPCMKCLQGNNNGHLTMFHSTSVKSTSVKMSKRPISYKNTSEFFNEPDR